MTVPDKSLPSLPPSIPSAPTIPDKKLPSLPPSALSPPTIPDKKQLKVPPGNTSPATIPDKKPLNFPPPVPSLPTVPDKKPASLPTPIPRAPTIPNKKLPNVQDCTPSLVGINDAYTDKQETLELEDNFPPFPTWKSQGKPPAASPIKTLPLSRLSLNPTRLAPTIPEVPVRRRSPSAPTFAKPPDTDPEPVLPESDLDDDDPASTLNPPCSSHCCMSQSAASTSSPNQDSSTNHGVDHTINAMAIPPPLSMQPLIPAPPLPPPLISTAFTPPPPPCVTSRASAESKTATTNKVFGKENFLEEIRKMGGVTGAGLKRTVTTKPVPSAEQSGTLTAALQMALSTIHNANRSSDPSDDEEDGGWDSNDSF